MSYIRGLSNPEGLYIISTTSSGRSVTTIFQDGKAFSIPCHTFETLIKKYAKDDGSSEFYSYKGASVAYVCMNGQYRWVLAYKDWQIEMYDVTWYYIAHGNACRRKWVKF